MPPKSAFLLLLSHVSPFYAALNGSETSGEVLYTIHIPPGNLLRQSHAWVTKVTFGEVDASDSNPNLITNIAFWESPLGQKMPQI